MNVATSIGPTIGPTIGTRVLPAAPGLPFKHAHWPEIDAQGGGAAWFELHAENYMGAGRPRRTGCCMRSARSGPCRCTASACRSAARAGSTASTSRASGRWSTSTSPRASPSTSPGRRMRGSTSTTCCRCPIARRRWSGVADHIDEAQEALGRRWLLENPSAYLALEAVTMDETDFLAEVARRTGCGLLLDVNNVWISAVNRDFDPVGYLDAFPLRLVGEIHLRACGGDGRRLLIDTHDRRVDDAVWALYGIAVARTGPVPTLIEWDSDVPDFSILLEEAAAAAQVMAHWEVAR